MHKAPAPMGRSQQHREARGCRNQPPGQAHLDGAHGVRCRKRCCGVAEQNAVGHARDACTVALAPPLGSLLEQSLLLLVLLELACIMHVGLLRLAGELSHEKAAPPQSILGQLFYLFEMLKNQQLQDASAKV